MECTNIQISPSCKRLITLGIWSLVQLRRDSPEFLRQSSQLLGAQVPGASEPAYCRGKARKSPLRTVVQRPHLYGALLLLSLRSAPKREISWRCAGLRVANSASDSIPIMRFSDHCPVKPRPAGAIADDGSLAGPRSKARVAMQFGDPGGG